MSETERPTRIGVRRGATIPRGRFESERIEYSAETDLASGLTLQEGLRDLSKPVDELLAEEKKRIQSTSSPQPNAGDQLTAQGLDQLPWKLYREAHRAGWIFTDKAPRALVERLEREAKPLVVGESRYRFSGPEENPKLFVSRVPVKEER